MEWLQEDVRLAPSVLNIEEEFSNGFLFGEILHLYNQQVDFSLFWDRPTAEAKVNNFCLLEPTMRDLGVPFSAKVACAVMRGEPGAASSVLYQLKMVLERLQRFSAPVSLRAPAASGAVGGAAAPLPNLSQRPRKPQYDGATHALFEAAIRRAAGSDKQISLGRVARPFRIEGERQAAELAAHRAREEKKADALRASLYAEMRRERTDKRAIMAASEERHWEQWLRSREECMASEAAGRRYARRKLLATRTWKAMARQEDAAAVAENLDVFD
ncbi:unnamed protein product, partial [Phaeothamnion confervicola]